MRGKLIALGVAGACLVAAASAQATFPGGDGRIAFVGKMPGCDGICTIEPNGGGLTQISPFGNEPSWSANGRRIVFLAGSSGFPRTIYTMNADGTDKTRVPHLRGYISSAGFSPDGRRIVYLRERSEAPPRREAAIYTIRTDGTDRRLVFASRRSFPGPDWAPHYPAAPAYSPSGKRIAFAGKPAHKPGGIWTIRTDGTDLRNVTSDPASYSDHYPDWRPDGTRLALLRYTYCDPHECSGPVKFTQPDGSGIHGNGESNSVRFRYAPSGARLVSWATEGFEYFEIYCGDIFTETVGGDGHQAVTDNCANYHNGLPSGVASESSWQPDPASTFLFTKLKRNRHKGTAKLTVKVPGAGELRLAKNQKVKGKHRSAEGEGTVNLPIEPRPKARKRLRRKGEAKVNARVSYTPNGGPPNTQTKKLRLKRKR